jgi:peroxiredoxin
VAVITFAPVGELDAYRSHLDLPFPLLADPDRAIYQRFGLERGSLRAVYGLGTLRMYAELIGRRGRRMRRPTQDTRQLGGDFVIDARGVLHAEFRPPSPDTRPSVATLVDAVRAAR